MTQPETTLRSARASVPFGVRVAGAWSGYFLVIAAALAVLVWIMGKLGMVTVCFVTGVMIAALLQPLVTWLMKRGLGRGISAIVSFLVGMGSIGLLLWFVIAQLIGSQDEFSRQLGTAERKTRTWLIDGPFGLDASTADKYTIHIGNTISSHSGDITAQAGGYIGTGMAMLSGIILTLFCLLFMLADDGGIFRWCVKLFPKKVRGYVDVAGAAAWRTLVVYMRSLVVLAVLNALAMLPIMWIAGVPLAIPLTVLLFLGSLVPLVGVLAAGAVMFVVALIANGPLTAVLMVLALAVIIQLFGNILNPIILGKFVNLHPIVILLGIAGGTILGGAFGAFTAVPFIAVANNMVKVMRRHHADVEAAGGVDDAEELDEGRLEALAQDSL